MAFTKTNLVSLTVMLLGHKPVTTLDNADDLVTSAVEVIDMLLPSVLSTGNWRFAMCISQLSLSTQIPPPETGWQNIYLLPAGWLKNVRVIPQNYVYEIYNGNQIWCNWGTLSPVYMEYSYLVPYAQLPAHFVNYFIYEVAGMLALTNAQKVDYAAHLETKRILQLAMAAGTDAQNRPNYSQVDIPVLNNRVVSGIIGPSVG